jgi:cell division protease FtsH
VPWPRGERSPRSIVTATAAERLPPACQKRGERVAGALEGGEAHAGGSAQDQPVGRKVFALAAGDGDHADELCELLDETDDDGAPKDETVDDERLDHAGREGAEDPAEEEAERRDRHRHPAEVAPLIEESDECHRNKEVADEHHRRDEVRVSGKNKDKETDKVEGQARQQDPPPGVALSLYRKITHVSPPLLLLSAEAHYKTRECREGDSPIANQDKSPWRGRGLQPCPYCTLPVLSTGYNHPAAAYCSFSSIRDPRRKIMESDVKAPDPWKRERKDEGGVHNPQPFFSFKNPQFRFSFWYVLVGIALLFLISYLMTPSVSQQEQVVSFSEFKQRIESGGIRRVQMTDTFYLGLPLTQQELKNLSAQQQQQPITVYKTVRVDDPQFIPLLDSHQVEYYAVEKRDNALFNLLLSTVLPILIMIAIWRLMSSRMGNAGSGVLSFGQNKARIVAEGDIPVRFADVAGVDEAKEELMEVVDFLKQPEKYTAIGGKIPKGVLLVGSPGTGKTMLAKATAGEAGVPFFRISGSEFVEMFVGVGAARVRDLFRQAREKAPCIVFIDELDAIGKSRINAMAANDEREQTLNQLLVEMDGFDSTSGVVILAATNRPEILDPALLRPGRFDRTILVDHPDLKGREAILKIHTRNVKLSPAVDLETVARMTPGLAGADLANIVNEAALLAVRARRERITQTDFEEAIEKNIAGLRKKNRLINQKERDVVAHHEVGHALVAACTPGADPVQKVSIVPRGFGALGYTLQTPTEERFLLSYDELISRVDVLLGGRAAEQIIYGQVSTGAANDLAKATDIVKKMITEYGMSEKFRNVVLTRQQAPLLGARAEPGMIREYSESTQSYVDEEIARIVKQRYETVLELLRNNRDSLERIAKKLLEVETLDEKAFQGMVNSDHLKMMEKSASTAAAAAPALHAEGQTL